MKSALIIILLGIIVWFGTSIIKLENERYALELEICGNFDPSKPATLNARDECLERVQTRTGPIDNLLYGLKLI